MSIVCGTVTDTRVSFIRSLCMGEIEQDVLLPFPELSEDEKSTLHSVVESVDDLLGSRTEDFAKWDAAGEMPADFIEELRQFGMFGLVIPEDYGGIGFKSATYSRTLQQVAKYDASVAVTIGAHSSIGMRGLLLYGTEEQKQKYYPKLVTGEMIAAFCLTEPGAGSDAASVKTHAVRDGEDWVLNGTKVWITNGGFADFFTVFAKTGEADQRSKLTAFIVTRDMEGVSTGPHEDKMGLRASATTSLFLDNVRVPKENVLGPLNGGFKVAMNILNSGRSGLGGGCIGGMKAVIEWSSKYAQEREQFDRPIAEFGLIQQKIGHMVVECYATESVVSMVAALADRGYEDYSVEAAISKVFGTEALWRTADEGLQVAGGNGFMREYPYERILRDSRINRIYEGTNDILRLFIALTAMNDVGQSLKELSSSLKGVFNDPIKGFGLLYNYARRRASWATGFGNEKGAFSKIHDQLKDEAEIFEESTRELAAAVDRLLRKHGKQVIEKQFATRRLADIMIDLFVLACVLARVTTSIDKHGADQAAREIEIARVFANQVRGRVARNFRKIDANDDEYIKSLAKHAYAHAGYPYDVI